MNYIDFKNQIYDLYIKASELQKTTKKKDKEMLLSEYLTDDTFVKMITFLLDPRITTGLDRRRLSHIPIQGKYEDAGIIDMLNYISTNNTGTNEAIYTVQYFIARYSADNKSLNDFLIELFSKNLKIGVEAKTVNAVYQKAYGKPLIEIWEVQQGYAIDKYKFKPGEWFSISEKLNGCRATYYKGRFISRQGTVIDGLDHIKNEIDGILHQIPALYVLDGELRRKNIDHVCDNENFAIGTGIINSDSKEKTEIEFIVFDIIPLEEFEDTPVTTYSKRKDFLESFTYLISNCLNVKTVPIYYSGTDTSQIDKWLEYASSNDKEGCMVNRDVPYFRKRHNGCLKVKKFYTMDLPIIGFEEGTGKLKGTLGALIADFDGNVVKIGSGFSDADRDLIWNNKADYIDRIVEVKYKDITKDKSTGLRSLQFPIYICIREVGKCVSYD